MMLKKVFYVLMFSMVFTFNLSQAATYRVGQGAGYDYGSIYGALTDSTEGDTILVADGNYTLANGEAFPLRLKEGVKIKREDPATLPHIIGDRNSTVIYAANFYDFNTVLDGLWISGGIGYETDPFNLGTLRYGGGIVCEDVQLTITNCVVSECEAMMGGGIYCHGSTYIYLENSEVRNNYAGWTAGGIYCLYGGFVEAKRCVVRNNTAQNKNGSIGCWHTSSIILEGCIIRNNSASDDAGIGIYDNSTASIVNCTIAGNTATLYDFASFTYTSGCSYAIINSNFIDNTANRYYGGMPEGVEPLINCIFHGNLPDNIAGTSSPVTYCNIEGGYPGVGNIDVDPMFVDPDNGDYRLQAGSPCIDAGTNTGAPATDIDGEARPNPDTGIADIGADEFYFYSPTPTPTPLPSSTPLPTDTPTATPIPTPVAYQIQVSLGWKAFSFACRPVTQYNAELVASEINDLNIACTHVAEWQAGSWNVYQDGMPFNNFDLNIGCGYMVRCLNNGEWTVEGHPVTEVKALTLNIGWSFVSIPYSDMNYTSQSLVTAINNTGGQVTHVARWSMGGWLVYQAGLPFNVFPIKNDEPYFIRSLVVTNWTP